MSEDKKPVKVSDEEIKKPVDAEVKPEKVVEETVKVEKSVEVKKPKKTVADLEEAVKFLAFKLLEPIEFKEFMDRM